MKKQIPLILALCLALSATAIAHPGKTDSNGGHYDQSTGQYHYHHGYEAHQHTGGVCPYDFDDRTGENSGSPSSGSSFVTNPNSSSKSPAKKTSAWNTIWNVLYILLIGPPMLFLAFLFFVVPILIPILKAIGKRNAEKEERESEEDRP